MCRGVYMQGFMACYGRLLVGPKQECTCSDLVTYLPTSHEAGMDAFSVGDGE